MSLAETLFALERELAHGSGDTYQRLLADHAVVVVPGMTMDKPQTVAAMNASPGWDAVAFADQKVTELSDQAALLTYRFLGRRGDDFDYKALMGSVYVLRGEEWRLAFHQQTPLAPE
ncbi:MAG TPA: nuclear transport factor 2 family protein [Solirubrobacteraceae bacterium]|jgi:hypothetical protein|nr:nuclear transport factor 2 family protein [Solirubrobacteraceae bacterium]